MKKLIIGIGLLIIIASQDAKAGKFFETVGISTAVGLVLGAATLPFYESPGSHTGNVAVGAGLGLATGLGILVYDWLFKSDDEAKDYFYNTSRKPLLLENSKTLIATRSSTDKTRTRINPLFSPISRYASLTVRPAAVVWTPLVSLTF